MPTLPTLTRTPDAEPRNDRRRARALTAIGLGVFVVATVVLVWTQGLILSRDWLFGWLLLGLLAVSLADPLRWARGVLVDWLPLMAVLLCYDLSLPVRLWLGITPHIRPQLDADLVVFGELPTVTLQRWLYTPGTVHWYEYVGFVVYLSHFFVTLLVLALLWKLSHRRFRQYRTLVVTLAPAGFVTYVLVPAVPPWMASQNGHIPPVARVIANMWDAVGIAPAKALFENRNEFYNQEAALPSLHAAYPMLLLLFLWPAVRWWARAGLVAYTLTMAFTLVYSAEHYVSDILLGWLYAAGVVAAVGWWRRRRDARRKEPEPEPVPEPAALPD